MSPRANVNWIIAKRLNSLAGYQGSKLFPTKRPSQRVNNNPPSSDFRTNQEKATLLLTTAAGNVSSDLCMGVSKYFRNAGKRRPVKFIGN